MRETFLPFSPPLIGEEEIAEVTDTLRSDWITTGPKVKRFEEEFAKFVGAADALAVSSCTAALHLSLLVLGIGSGDAVITSALTFCSGVHVIEHVGARPILVDVEQDTLNLDPNHIGAAVERARREGLNVRAIIVTHLYGHPCELDDVLALAEKYDLAVIEDAAHSLPAKYKGATIGSHATSANVPVMTCFSFYATKNLTTAEGGMLAGPHTLVEKARIWALHGMSRDAWNRYAAQGSWFYDVVCPGYKYNMTDLQAAVGLRQLRKLPQFHQRRREIIERYNSAFYDCEAFELPRERPGIDHAWHLYVLRLNSDSGIRRDDFISQLKELNIGTSVHFIPIHLHKYYREKYGYLPTDFPTALEQYKRMVSLPLSPRMTEQDTNDVISAILQIVKDRGNPPKDYERVGVISG